MDNGGAGLVVLLLGDPLGLEGWEAMMEPPIQVEYFLSGGAMRLMFVLLGDKFGHRLLHTVNEAREHGRTTGQDDIGVEVLPELMSNITPPDGVTYKVSQSVAVVNPLGCSKTAKVHLSLPSPRVITCRGGICQCRQCRRQCKIFASCVNFSIYTHFLCFFLLKLLKLGEIDGVKFLA